VFTASERQDCRKNRFPIQKSCRRSCIPSLETQVSYFVSGVTGAEPSEVVERSLASRRDRGALPESGDGLRCLTLVVKPSQKSKQRAAQQSRVRDRRELRRCSSHHAWH
jgi:hypothetical protein